MNITSSMTVTPTGNSGLLLYQETGIEAISHVSCMSDLSVNLVVVVIIIGVVFSILYCEYDHDQSS